MSRLEKLQLQLQGMVGQVAWVSRASGVSRSTLVRILRGQSNPTIGTIEKIEAALKKAPTAARWRRK